MLKNFNELVMEGLVEKSGGTKNTKYITIKPVGNREGISSCFSSISLEAISKIKRPKFERPPVAYNEDWLRSYEPNQTFYLSENMRQQLWGAGSKANNHDPAGTFAHKVFSRLLIDLSFNSSRLEGNTYSLLETEKLLLEGDGVPGKPDAEKTMILNHKEAIRYLVENAPRIKLKMELIYMLHYLLSDGLVDSKNMGSVRTNGVRIGGSVYLPYEDPKRLELQLEKIAKKAAKINDPFEQSFFLLTHISYIQAFEDVNKWTARLSANIPLITKNFVPLSFNDISVEDYMAAIIAVYELQDVHPLADLYYYYSYMRTCVAYDATAKAVGFDEVRVRYRNERRAIIREIILQCLVGEAMQKFITQASQKIPNISRKDFLGDIAEDLELINKIRIVGLGVTPGQLRKWMNQSSKSLPK